VSDAMTALLRGLVDYAGLFPPAALPMDEAVRRYATYRVGAHRGMLARFVVPVARLEEFAHAAATVHNATDGPWGLSVLASVADAPTLAAFERAHSGLARIEVIEAKASDEKTIAALAEAYGTRRLVYVELPVALDPGPLVAALGRAGLRAKIRTGGVTRDAFPSAEDVARFLARCVEHKVPFKATAGLHHPMRGEYALTYAPDAERGVMYGFLNVFLAAVLLRAGHTEEELLPLLEERDVSAFTVTPAAISWRGMRADAATIQQVRSQFAGSFGSCSFEEPVQDLASLSFLPPSV
jgi:hypothetical protein